MSSDAIRLQKYLARSGVASRRESEEIILAGRVKVNGVVVTQLGTKINPETDAVCVDETSITLPDDHIVLFLNKPAGYLTSMKDPFNRPCVSELVPIDLYPGLFPVGRLDFDTTGLLLFTTDGELGNALLHPRKEVHKTYLAQVKGVVSKKELDVLREGVVLEDGKTAPAQVSVKKQGKTTTLLSVTIHEGRKRQVKRMCAAIGHPVQKLQRISFAGITLENLPSGSWRLATSQELAFLKSQAGL